MTTFARQPARNRDQQDMFETHVWSEIERVDGAGHIMKIKGTRTVDEEVVFAALAGLGINMEKDTNAEVHVFSGGSDTSLKYGFVMIPRDKEHSWKPGQNGLQKFDDPKRRIQWGKERLHLTDKNVALAAGVIEVRDGRVIIRGDVHISGEVRAGKDIHTPTIRYGGISTPQQPEIPGFEEE